MRHIAILHARYLDAILAGAKTIESRLSRARGLPFGIVAPGDTIYFKQSSGPVRAVARVSGVSSFEDLRPEDVLTLARRYREAVGAGEEYWESRRDCRYATLIWLADVRACDHAPGFARRAGARSAWFALDHPRPGARAASTR